MATIAQLSCQELVELVTDYLEGALPRRERLRFERHLDRCDGCWAYLEQMRQTIALAGRLGVEDLSPEAQAALMDLCRPFAARGFIAECDVVSPNAIPAPADVLLVHQNHMTVALERHHGKPVDVHVLDERRDGDFYTRKISLTPRDAAHVVEWGIARLNFRHLPAEVRDQVLARRTPLGAHCRLKKPGGTSMMWSPGSGGACTARSGET